MKWFYADGPVFVRPTTVWLFIYLSHEEKKIEQCEVGYDEILAVYLRLSTVTAKNVATAEILLGLGYSQFTHSTHELYL